MSARGALGSPATSQLQEEVEASGEHHDSLLTALAKAGDMVRVEKQLGQMAERGFAPSLTSCAEIMKGYAKSGMIGEARSWLATMKVAGLTPELETYNALLSTYAKVGSTADVREVMESMTQAKVEPDVETWLWALIASSRSPAGSSRSSVQAGPYDDPEKVFRLMIAAGIEPNNFVFGALDKALGASRRAALCRELGVKVGSKETAKFRRPDKKVGEARKRQMQELKEKSPQVNVWDTVQVDQGHNAMFDLKEERERKQFYRLEDDACGRLTVEGSYYPEHPDWGNVLD